MKNLKRLRREAGLTQRGLGRLVGMPRWKIAHAELGERKLTPGEVSVIREALVERCRKNSERILKALGANQERTAGTIAPLQSPAA